MNIDKTLSILFSQAPSGLRADEALRPPLPGSRDRTDWGRTILRLCAQGRITTRRTRRAPENCGRPLRNYPTARYARVILCAPFVLDLRVGRSTHWANSLSPAANAMFFVSSRLPKLDVNDGYLLTDCLVIRVPPNLSRVRVFIRSGPAVCRGRVQGARPHHAADHRPFWV